MADCGVVPALAVMDAGGPTVTVKPLTSEATSAPVVVVTVRAPKVAPFCTVRLAVALVPLFTVRLLTVIPAPKLATVVPCTKFVFSPTIATLASVCPT